MTTVVLLVAYEYEYEHEQLTLLYQESWGGRSRVVLPDLAALSGGTMPSG